MSFQSLLIKELVATLSPLGFCRLKSNHILIRLLNNEIVEYVTFRPVPSLIRGKKAFSMMAGVETIYSPTFSVNHFHAYAFDFKSFRWLDSSIKCKGPYWNVYHYDEETIHNSLQEASKDTVEFVSKYLNQVVNLPSYISFCKYMAAMRLYFADRLNEDSLLLIKTNNHESFQELIDIRVQWILNSELSMEEKRSLSYSIKSEVSQEIQSAIVGPRDRVYASVDLMNKTTQELKRRKSENSVFLLSHSISLSISD